MATSINGLIPVFGGKVVPFENYAVEVMSNDTYNDRTSGIATYIYEGDKKVAIRLYMRASNSAWVDISRYRTKDCIKRYHIHYCSLVGLRRSKSLQKRYGEYVDYLERAYRHFFGIDVTKYP